MRKMKINGHDISKLILGTDYFGTNVSESESFRMMDRFYSLGGNTIDTARLYASWIEGGDGASEKTIGKWINSNNLRNNIFLITKGGAVPKGSDKRARLTYADLRNDLSESLEALKTDSIDLYFLHRDDESIPVSEIMGSLGEFYKSGFVKSIGASNWRSSRIEEANSYAIKNGLPVFAASEIQWSLARSTPDAHGDMSLVCMNDSEYNYYLSTQMPLLAFSSQAKGYFIRGTAEGGITGNNSKALDRFDNPENRKRLQRVKILMKENGLSAAQVTLGYITSNRLNAAAIIGCKNLSQLDDSMAAAETRLKLTDIDFLIEG